MKTIEISVTEAARKFDDCIRRASRDNVAFVLLRDGAPVARLVPEREKVCTGRDLARVLARVELSANEAKAWHDDLQTARKKSQAPAGN